MRITQDLLHKFAREAVRQRKRSEPDLHAAYIMGSLLNEDPLLGGTTDIDLVLVHKYKIPVERETQALTPEVSLDIFHKRMDDYAQHRQLRQDPWLGYPLTYNHILLFDTDHWLEFIQSSVSAEFHRSDYVLDRVNAFSTTARENWFSLVQTPSQTHQEWLHRYMETLALAANAVNGLIGPPLTTRRFMINFNERANTLGVPQILAGFNGLLGLTDAQQGQWDAWINSFELDYDHLLETADPPVHLSQCRKRYYLDAIQALAKGNDLGYAIWPLLRIWLDVNLASPQPLPGSEIWEEFLTVHDLTKDFTSSKTEALDAYLDGLEIIIENWTNAYGL